MKYIIYILLFLVLASILQELSLLLLNKKLPNSYFEFGNYQIDKENIKNTFTVRNRIKACPDSVATRGNKGKIYNSSSFTIIRLTLYVLISVIVVAISFFNEGVVYALKAYMIWVYVNLIIESVIVTFFIRYLDAKETSYYMGVVYRALLNIKIFEEKNIETYAALPLGYTNLYFWNKEKKGYVTKMVLNRKNRIAELYSGEKRKYRIRYFDLNVIEHTDFLDQFISDLTFVENKVDLKRLFTDVYFSNKDMIELNDYITDTTHG